MHIATIGDIKIAPFVDIFEERHMINKDVSQKISVFFK
jgi:hypothetical protein